MPQFLRISFEPKVDFIPNEDKDAKKLLRSSRSDEKDQPNKSPLDKN
jgi:hypothetical protein